MGVGGEICILAKDVFRALIFIQLHQETLLTDLDMERIIDLCAVEVSDRRISLAEWGHSQIDKCSLHAMTAESARLACGLPNLGRKCHRRHAFLRSFGIQDQAATVVSARSFAPFSDTVSDAHVHEL